MGIHVSMFDTVDRTSRLTVTVIKRWFKYMFWGLWAGQSGCSGKMSDHKTHFLQSIEYTSAWKYQIYTIKYYNIIVYGYDGTTPTVDSC